MAEKEKWVKRPRGEGENSGLGMIVGSVEMNRPERRITGIKCLLEVVLEKMTPGREGEIKKQRFGRLSSETSRL